MLLIAWLPPGLAVGAPVPAPHRRIALVNGPRSLHRALELALSPWSLGVVSIEAPDPGGSMPDAAEKAQALAQQAGVDAVVWITTSGSNFVAWLYDAATQQTVTRRIGTGPPFEAPTEAAVALSVKTLLRTSSIAPAPPEQETRLAGEPRPSWGMFRVEAFGGARLFTGASDVAEPRAGMAFSVWPGDAKLRLGVALAVRTGPGVAVTRPAFVGRFSDTAAAASVRLGTPIGEMLALEVEAGVAAHFTALGGATRPSIGVTHVSRVNPSIDGGLLIDVRLPRGMRVGVQLGISRLLLWQRYLVGQTPVLELPSIQGDVGIKLGVVLD